MVGNRSGTLRRCKRLGGDTYQTQKFACVTVKDGGGGGRGRGGGVFSFCRKARHKTGHTSVC